LPNINKSNGITTPNWHEPEVLALRGGIRAFEQKQYICTMNLRHKFKKPDGIYFTTYTVVGCMDVFKQGTSLQRKKAGTQDLRQLVGFMKRRLMHREM